MANKNDTTIAWIIIGFLGIAALAFIIQKVQEFFDKNPWAGWLLFSIIVVIAIVFLVYLIQKVTGRR